MRWFWVQALFQPVMRAHGEEKSQNEIWSYGWRRMILAKYLKLRYQLLPYTYSVAYHSYQTGALHMRALFMDFPDHPKAADIPDEYMVGPAILVAPVSEWHDPSGRVPTGAGCRLVQLLDYRAAAGGQTIVGWDAPIETLPLALRKVKHRAAGLGGGER